MTAPDRVGWIVFPRYVKGAAPQITKIEPSVAFGRLIAEAYSPAGRLAGDQFQAMAGWMRDAEAFDLRYGQLDDAVAAVEAITGSPRLPHRNGVDRGSQAEV